MSTPQETFETSRSEKLRRIAELGIDPWGGRFDGHQALATIRNLPMDLPEDQRPRVRAAGRIIQRRGQGKIYFLDIKDWTGRIQVLIGQKQVGEKNWNLVQLLDLGDLIGVDGTFGKTKMGELTIFANDLHFLGKSLLPHPDKWGGMQDIEYRLRHRYLDLIYNPETQDRTLKRVQIIRTIRRYLDDLGFCEVETPALHIIAGGAAARPFITHHNALDMDLFLRIALELPLKRLLVGGLERIYEIGRVFRNEGISPRHNPEFTMLELYQAYGDYHTIMELTEGLIVACVKALSDRLQMPFGETTVDYTPPFQRTTYAEAFRQYVGVAMEDEEKVQAAAVKEGIKTTGKDIAVIIHELFEQKVEPQLTGPVFIYDYPAALCPLTKRKRDNDKIAERFELYVQHMELANAYTELNDPVLQEETFLSQIAGLPEEESMARMDKDFIRAMQHGMPPAGGLGIGIDRLVMLLTNSTTIRDVILFPLLRPEKK